VWFTSIKDDAHGGDTNGDGSASSAAAGDWTSVFAEEGSRIELNRTVLRYGGASNWANLATSYGTAAAIVWDGGGSSYSANDGARVSVVTATLSNLDVHFNAADGIELNPATPPTFTGQFNANNNVGYAFRINSNPGSIAGNFLGTGNGVSGIYVNGTLGGGASDQKWTWVANPTFPYVVGVVSVTGPDSLEIAAGAVVKFNGSGSYLQAIYAGSLLRTLGTSENPVWFTSLKDDQQGSDTNGDGSASTPAGGDWLGVLADEGSRIELNQTWCTYGGSSGYGNVATSYGSAASLAWNGGGSLRSANTGIGGSYSSSFALSGVRVASNSGRGVNVSAGGSASATGCDIYDNDSAGSSYGYANLNSGITVDATSSWWGDASGPYDPSPGPPSINAGGLGDGVTDYVNYGLWLSAANTNQPPNGFALVSPANGAEVLPLAVTFVWRRTIDPDGSAIVYDLLVDDDPAFGSPLVSATALADTTFNAGNIFVMSTPLYWKVTARDAGGGARLGAPTPSVFTIPPATDVDPGRNGDPGAPLAFQVRAPTPNPFRDASTLAFTLPAPGSVRLDVFDVSGRLVRTLTDGPMRGGEHAIAWDGRNGAGREVGAGVYFYRLVAGSDRATRRVILAR